MGVALIAVAVCLFSAGVLFGATAYTRRLRTRILLGLTALSLLCYAALLLLRPTGPLLSNALVLLGALLILAVVYFALHRFGHRGALPFLVPVAGLLLAVAVGLLVGGVFAIPFIAATTIAYLWLAPRRGNEA